jgi:hypothetical protein
MPFCQSASSIVLTCICSVCACAGSSASAGVLIACTFRQTNTYVALCALMLRVLNLCLLVKAHCDSAAGAEYGGSEDDYSHCASSAQRTRTHAALRCVPYPTSVCHALAVWVVSFAGALSLLHEVLFTSVCVFVCPCADACVCFVFACLCGNVHALCACRVSDAHVFVLCCDMLALLLQRATSCATRCMRSWRRWISWWKTHLR